jgi:hypothetical protein
MASLEELLKQDTAGGPKLIPQEESSDISTLESVFSGIASGLIQIPKGLFSLGATLYDLGAGTEKAAEVEKFFDDLTEFDEKAAETGAGRIAELLVNIGVPGGVAFKAGTKLATKALTSKKLGQYFVANNPNVTKATKKALELNAKGKTARFISGAAAGGGAEGIFVGDVEEAGTFGDLLGGPTELERDEEYDPQREIINRIKFGTEGALFTGVIGGVGATIKKLANRSKDLRYSDSKMDRMLDRFASKFRARSGTPEEFFMAEREQIGTRAADVNLAKQVSRNLDTVIDKIFPAFKTIANKQVGQARTLTLEKLNDLLLSGKPDVNKAGQFKFGPMDAKIQENVVNYLKSSGAKAKDIKEIIGNLEVIRDGWGDMFSALGRQMTPDEIADYQKLFSQKFKNYLGSTYQIFQNKSLIPFFNYRPAEESVNELKQIFKDTALAKGRKLTDQQAEYYVERLIKSARLPKGFRMDKPGDPIFEIPDFFVGKSQLDDAVTDKGFISLSSLPEKQRRVIESVLGKEKNVLQTVLGGTGRISLITRRNQFFGDLLEKSEDMKQKGGRGMFYETRDEATLALGPRIKQINIDPNRTLEAGITNPLNGQYAIEEIADALSDTAQSMSSNSIVGKLYENLVLYPKATSQLAKTVLSPITHMRNFVSASFFALANGALPSPSEMKTAYSALQVALPGAQSANDLYRKLLRLGVVNSNVRLGDLRRLLEDVKFGETLTSDKGMRMLLKPLSKIKKMSEDLYTAEDDFWKISTWAAERGRLEKAYSKYGINRTAAQLDEEAAGIVRNNIPNYDYVSDFVKGLRKLPLGNFVSFPAEILRTSTNIVRRALDEINYTVTLPNGQTVKPLAGIGYRRLLGMGVTTTAVPYATSEAFRMMYDVSKDEIDAMKRYVAPWSKNSTILPIKDKDGTYRYIDFSHANAYDTLTRPFQTVFNSVQEGIKDKDGIMDDFIKGSIEATKELGQPFVSESIWTEALTDLIARGGRTREGSQVFNEEDTPGNKMQKAIAHLVKAQMPLNIEQLKRMDLAIEPVDVIQKGKFDKYGQTYDIGPELAGFVGLRAVKLDIPRTLDFKIADYQKGTRQSRQLFTRETLAGGPVEPRQIIDAYLNANRALFNTQKTLYEDVKAANVLNAKEEDIVKAFDRVGRRTYGSIVNGTFRPLNISKEVAQAFQENADKLGLPNPFEQSVDVIGEIRSILSDVSLDQESLPELINPFIAAEQAGMPQTIGLPPMPDANIIQQAGQFNLNQGVTGGQNFANLSTADKLDYLRKLGL